MGWDVKCARWREGEEWRIDLNSFPLNFNSIPGYVCSFMFMFISMYLSTRENRTRRNESAVSISPLYLHPIQTYQAKHYFVLESYFIQLINCQLIFFLGLLTCTR
jgi:hypothetical protein